MPQVTSAFFSSTRRPHTHTYHRTEILSRLESKSCLFFSEPTWRFTKRSSSGIAYPQPYLYTRQLRLPELNFQLRLCKRISGVLGDAEGNENQGCEGRKEKGIKGVFFHIFHPWQFLWSC